MPKIFPQDPGSTEVQSPLIAGLSESVSKISDILNLQTAEITDVELRNVYISETDKNRIYQAPEGFRLWMQSPTPVFKLNGEVITPTGNFFNIDYVGGSITFPEDNVLKDIDVVTVSCTYITGESQKITEIESSISSVTEEVSHYKGAFATTSALNTQIATGTNGDFAIILEYPAVFVWKDTAWVDARSVEDISKFYTKEEVDNKLNEKQANIVAHGASDADDNYYYGGRKDWQDLNAKVKDTPLTGINTTQTGDVTASDTVVSAIGKLQGTIKAGNVSGYLKGNSDPTDVTKGEVGQRYVNTSNGKWWILKSITGGKYIWEEGAYTATKLTTPRTINGAKFDGTEDINIAYAWSVALNGTPGDQVTYIDFAEIATNIGINNVSLLVSVHVGGYGASKNLFYLQAANYSGNFSVIVTQISGSKYSFNPFGYTTIDNKVIFYLKRVGWSLNSYITVLNSEIGLNAPNIKIYHGKVIENEPDGWTEIPVRKLLANGEVDAASDLTGILPVANGGTGNATGTAEYLQFHKIIDGSDLNDIRTPGIYCSLGAKATTIKNKPSKIVNNYPFSLTVVFGYGAQQIYTEMLTHKTFIRSFYGYENSWNDWTEVLTQNGGAVTGQIENYGGIGFSMGTSTSKTPNYIAFAKYVKTTPNTITGSCIISSVDDYGSVIGGVWIAEFGLRHNTPQFKIDCIHPGTRGVVFGYWSDENYYYIGAVVLSGYNNDFTVTPLCTRSCSGAVEFIKGSRLTSTPTDWTEIPQRILQDAEQVTETANLALQGAMPRNKLIADDTGKAGVYVVRGKQKLSALLSNVNSSLDVIHPAFMVNDKGIDTIWFGKYQGFSENNRIYSLPSVDPAVNINFDTFATRCHNKGTGHHCITAAEWAYLALSAKKNGTQPKGNNNYGKDVSETDRIAIPTYKDNNGTTCRVATGTGPLTWSDNGQLDGVWDLNGNIWEWVSGLRLVYGELQVIPFNNAVTADTSTASTAWRAVNASAANYADLFVTPDGKGTTAGTVKLNWVSGHWQWQAAAITKSNSTAAFAATTSEGLSTFCKMYLQAMALLPEDGAAAEDYNGDWFWANTNEAERCALRGGSWYSGAQVGVFALSLRRPRSSSASYFGGRPAFVKL